MTAPSYHNPEFDAFAENYDAALEEGIAVTGEKKEFFAKGRVEWLSLRLQEHPFVPRAIVDFGCGTGTATPLLLAIPGAQKVVGLEVSSRSLEVARRLHGAPNIEFQLCSVFQPCANIDLAFCNGVFHHILPEQRADAVKFVYDALRPGGFFAFWENNPWNPGSRYIMSRIPFDRDAITLSAPQARSLLREAGFRIVASDFLFIFPRFFSPLRWFEPMLCRLPIGAQYQVLARKP
jgi:SAM-dependent methyltransferase